MAGLNRGGDGAAEAGRRRGPGLGLVAALAAWAAGGVAAGQELPYDREPIKYLTAKATDPIARLQERLDRGEQTLERDRRRGYLPAVLEALGVAPSSQGLVFSKTSFQHTRISPKAPRALYFGDDVYVGWVRGGDYLEVSAVDPQLGAVFYLLDQDAPEPKFERQTHSCLACHASSRTQGVPGHLIRSVYPDPGGQPVYNAGSFVTDHASPLSERWGGWYVTGTHGDQPHLGNAFVRDRDRPEQLDPKEGSNVTSLSDRFDTRAYLTDSSDLVALMVLEHQTQGHNRITAASYQARIGAAYDAGINQALGRPEGFVSETTTRRIDRAAEELVRYFLFAGEPKLTAPVAGTTDFARQFAARGQRDGQGRSLRDLDLQTRLFRYPCSYLIETEAFAALPAPVKTRVFERLLAVLTADDPGPDFTHLTPELRRDILEILRATQPDFPPAPAPAAP